jgi:hypothetical protein
MSNIVVAVLCGWFGTACAPGYLPNGERELRPPRAGIQVGSLYYVREKPTDNVSSPANLQPLCSVNLATYGITLASPQPVADVDLLSNLALSGSLSGVQTRMATLGLNGSVSSYFEYKITNVMRTDIQYLDAEKIFSARATRDDCLNWRGNVGKNNWAIYQIQAISSGDINFGRKTDWALEADVSAKLLQIEPQVKASIKRSSSVQMNGKGLVVSFVPILRN